MSVNMCSVMMVMQQTNDDVYVASVTNDCVGDGGDSLQETTRKIIEGQLVEFLRQHKLELAGIYDLNTQKPAPHPTK